MAIPDSNDLSRLPVPKLAVRGVTRRYAGRTGAVEALRDIWLDVAEGEFLVLVGPSGCGKSTLLSILAGLDAPDGGEVLLDGKRVTGPGPERSVVFQDGALFPWLTAQGNVEFGLKQLGVPRRERAERARRFLEMVHLDRFREAHPHELSGGMRQRVAIARALAMDPDVLLMDEPFSALDAQTREDLYQQLGELWERTRKTIVFVTHNVREAVCLGDRIVALAPRPGRVREEFRVSIPRPRFPDDADVARLAGRIGRSLKEERLRGPGEREGEFDAERDLAQAGVLRGIDWLLGDAV